MNTTLRSACSTLTLTVCVVAATPAVAIPIPEPDIYVSDTRPVETDKPSGHRRFPLVHLPGQDWLPARRAG